MSFETFEYAPTKKVESTPNKLVYEGLRTFWACDTSTNTRDQNASEIADTLTAKGDFGNDYKRKEAAKMFQKAAECGEKEVQELVDTVNKKLAERGSNLKLSATYSEESEARCTVPDSLTFPCRSFEWIQKTVEATITRSSPGPDGKPKDSVEDRLITKNDPPANSIRQSRPGLRLE